MSKKFIAIAGNVGVGKSTLTDLMSERLGWQPYYEAVDDNPYLADFYQDMRRWGFHSQIFFLSRRLRHQRQLVDNPNSVIQDRSIYEDAEIFARNLHERGNMSARDYDSYRELYEAITAFLPAPDLVIYLRASVPNLLKRIQQRGRDFEMDIEPAYLQQLNMLYEKWAADFALCPMLTVPADELDFVSNSAHLKLIVEKVEDRMRGKDEVVFAPEDVERVNNS